MLPALPTEKPRANRLAAKSTSSWRVASSFIDASRSCGGMRRRAVAFELCKRLQEEIGPAEIAGLQCHQHWRPRAFGQCPGHARIDLGADPERANAEPRHDG